MSAPTAGRDRTPRAGGYRIALTEMTETTEVTEPATTPHPDAKRIATVAELLSHWWSRPIADEVETWRAHADLADNVTEVTGGTRLPAPPPNADERALLDEHERLFVGPGPVPCPPFESCWRRDVSFDLRRGLMGPCTADLRELYARLGLEPSMTGDEFADYLPAEFEALSVALRHVDGADVSRSLLFDHLGRWLPEFADAVQGRARLPFYRDLAAHTMEWLRSAATTWTRAPATS